MRLVAVFLATLVVSFCAIAALLFYLQSEPSTASLDSDLAAVRSQIEDAEAEAAQYSGGLIVAMIGLRLEVLKTTEAMLKQKRSSYLRRVDLKYVVGSSSVEPSRDRMESIAADIAETESKLQADEAKAAQYSGGLIQGLSLATVATQRLTLAQLRLSYLGAKYGFIAPQLKGATADKPKVEAPGTPVQDRQAFE